MRERVNPSKRIREMAVDVIKEHKDLQWIETSGIRICYMESDKEKKSKGQYIYGECIVVKDLYRWFCPFDFLIVLYRPNIAYMTKNQKKILLYHELLHVDMSEKDGEPRYHAAPHDVEEFDRIIEEYGLHWEKGR